LEIIDDGLYQCSISDITFNKLIAFMLFYSAKVIQIACIGEFIKVEDVVVGFGELLEDEVGADKACATSDNYSFQYNS